MSITTKSSLAISIAAALFSTTALATNGLAPTGLGQVHKAMGGTAAGNPQNTMSMATNPASASFIDNGMDLAIEVFKPTRTSTTNTAAAAFFGAPGQSSSGDGRSTFLIPEIGYKRNVSGRTSLGIVIYGNGGMNTQYKAGFGPSSFAPFNGVGPAGKDTGVNLEQLFVSPTVSVKLNQRHSLGLSLNFVRQQFEATGLGIFDNIGFSQSPGSVTDNGVDTSTGMGATVGWMGKFNRFTAGASYRSEVSMGKLDKYKGLFPDQGTMDIPAALTIGGSMQVTPRTLIAADIQRIYYSKIGATGNAVPAGLPPVQRLGATNGPGFGWDDQTIIKVGVKHQATPKLALLGGINYGKSPVGSEDTFFNALTPAVVEKHLSVGLEYALTKNTKLVGSFTKAFDNTVKGDVTKGQAFDIGMEQVAFGVGLSVKM